MGAWIYLVLLILLIGYGIWGRAVWKDGKEQGLKHFWDPAIRRTLALTGLSDRMGRFLGMKDIARLVPWKRKEEAAADSICRAGSVFITGLAVFCALAGLAGIRQEEPDRSLVYREGDGWYVRKGEPGEPERILSLNGLLEEEEVTVQASAPNRQATKEEAEALFGAAQEYIDRVWLGQNESAGEVRYDLNLPGEIPGTNMTVVWEREDASLLSGQGIVWNDGLQEEGVITELTAVVRLDDLERRFLYPVRILPKASEESWEAGRLLQEYLEEEAIGKPYQSEIRLPDELGDRTVIWSVSEQEQIPAVFGFLLVAAAIPALYRAKVSERMRRRSIQLGADYPDIISKLSLYLGAGMSIRTAWGRITAEYRGEPGKIRSGKERRYAYEEMRLTWNELCIGVPEEEAFERFGQRVGELAYIRFGTLLAQNVRKGGSRLLELLEAEETEAFAQRKENARREGEKAGTRLLIPMFGMLVIVIAIVMIPAFRSM